MQTNLIFPKLFPAHKYPTISLIIYIAMVKLQYILLVHEVQKRFVVLSINQQRVLSVNYVVMDTSNIVLWVSVCVRNMQDFALAAF